MSIAHEKDFVHPLRFDGAMTRPVWFWRPRIARFAKGTARGATTRSKTGKVGMEMLSPVSQRCDESQLESIKAREQTPCRSLDESATTWRLACSSPHEVASPQNNRHKTAVPSL